MRRLTILSAVLFVAVAVVAAYVIAELPSPVRVQAAPQPPAAFHGSVTIGGATASGGIEIQARIGGVNYAHSSSAGDNIPRTASDGTYGKGANVFQVLADDPGTGAKEGGESGETIQFYVGGDEATEVAATAAFAAGTVTECNLSVTSLPPTPTPTPAPTPTPMPTATPTPTATPAPTPTPIGPPPTHTPTPMPTPTATPTGSQEPIEPLPAPPTACPESTPTPTCTATPTPTATATLTATATPTPTSTATPTPTATPVPAQVPGASNWGLIALAGAFTTLLLLTWRLRTRKGEGG